MVSSMQMATNQSRVETETVPDIKNLNFQAPDLRKEAQQIAQISLPNFNDGVCWTPAGSYQCNKDRTPVQGLRDSANQVTGNQGQAPTVNQAIQDMKNNINQMGDALQQTGGGGATCSQAAQAADLQYYEQHGATRPNSPCNTTP